MRARSLLASGVSRVRCVVVTVTWRVAVTWRVLATSATRLTAQIAKHAVASLSRGDGDRTRVPGRAIPVS